MNNELLIVAALIQSVNFDLHLKQAACEVVLGHKPFQVIFYDHFCMFKSEANNYSPWSYSVILFILKFCL